MNTLFCPISPLIRYLGALSIFVLLSCHPLFAQRNNSDEKSLLLKPIGNDTSSVLKANKLVFKNINVIEYYENPGRLAIMERYAKNKQWKELFTVQLDYVSNFGIKNFLNTNDMELVWNLARLSEYLGQMAVTKELYRVLLKHYRGNIQEAIIHYDSLNKYDRPLYVDIEEYYELVEKRRSIDTLRPPDGVMINMGEEINSKYDDYGPTMTGGDEQYFLFTSDRNRDTSSINISLGVGWKNEDIFISKKDEDGFWGFASSFDSINTKYNEGSPCMSKDGKTIIFSRCGGADRKGDCDLFVSYRVEQNGKNGKEYVWQTAENLGAINSAGWDSHPAFSITEDTLYFASDRKGGFGGSDVYYSVKQKDGNWGPAINIGPVINTKDSEVSPHPNPRYSNVLYFSSNGHIMNYGGFDIFKSHKVKGQWTEPKNVGPLVNGEGHEYYFFIDASSNWLFYSKSDEATGQLDLYSFPLPMEAKPNNITLFSGKVVEPSTGKVFTGIVTVIDLDEGVEVTPKHTRDDGTFEFELINNRKYLLLVEGDNFFRIEEVFYLNQDVETTVPATPNNSTITFGSIDFEPNSSKLLPSMENNLHLVIDFLVQHPEYNLKVIGHTDSDGTPEANLKLSKDRADVIKNYIVSYGRLDNARVQSLGMGSTQPIVLKESTEEHKRLNRRVEFKLFKAGEEDK